MAMDSVIPIFERYEEVRHRLPAANPPATTAEISSLRDIAPEADAFVFDAFGVLNVGETPIEGAAERLDQLRAMGRSIRILTNAASYGRARTVDKFRALGMRVHADEIVSSRDAALAGLAPGTWGCIAAPGDDLSDIPGTALRLGGDRDAWAQADGFLFLSAEGWSDARQAMLHRALRDRPRPLLIANADLVAPRDDGFSLEPGHFGHLLADDGIDDVRFFGKPFGQVYEMVEASLPGIPADRIVMCGDTLHTDILGAAARGWRTALVTRDGLFAGHDTAEFCARAKLFPTWRLGRV